jgi:hypothetical protein
MEYYHSTEFMYETENVPDMTNTYIDADENETSHYTFIVFEKKDEYTTISAYELAIDDRVYNLISFNEIGLTDDEAFDYMSYRFKIDTWEEEFYVLENECEFKLNHVNLAIVEIEKQIQDSKSENQKELILEIQKLNEEYEVINSEFETQKYILDQNVLPYIKNKKELDAKIAKILIEKNISGLNLPKYVFDFLG